MSDKVFLSIVTTFDPYPGVMFSFLKEYSRFVNSASYVVELIIVNGISAPEGKESEMPILTSKNTRLITSPRLDQGSAILHGILQSRGQMVVSVDPDMHKNLSDIGIMLKRHDQGDLLVYTRRIYRRDTSNLRRAASFIFNACLAAITKMKINDFNSPMFLISREALDHLLPLQLSPEAYKFHAYHLYRSRFSQIDIDVSGTKKKQSNYSMMSLVRLFFSRLALALRYRNLH